MKDNRKGHLCHLTYATHRVMYHAGVTGRTRKLFMTQFREEGDDTWSAQNMKQLGDKDSFVIKNSNTVMCSSISEFESVSCESRTVKF